MNHDELWRQVLSRIELETSRASFATWFQHTTLADVAEGRAVVSVPNAFTKDWLERKYHKSIVRALREHSDAVRSVAFQVASQQLQQKEPTKRAVEAARQPEEQLEFKEFSIDRETNLNPKYTFSSFIIGSFNELAHAAARSVAEAPGSTYNPLFIYGGVGLGKTHLLQAVGNHVRETRPNAKVLYTTSERFMNDFLQFVQNREPLQAFKEKYRSVDLLMIDDIQFIAGKIKTEEEFFHTFNVLYENGKQVVLSSDRPPQAISGLEERLRSRFQMGMVADVGEPEYEARLAILRVKSHDRPMPPSEEILEHVASVVQHNIRELEGALNILLAKGKMKGSPLTLEEAKDALEQLSARSQRIVTTQQIIKTVAAFYGIEEKDLIARSRKREVVNPRQIAMYLIREDFRGSYPYIGQKLGGRDHTTALHAHEKIVGELKKNLKLVEEIRQIRERLYKPS